MYALIEPEFDFPIGIAGKGAQLPRNGFRDLRLILPK
jgi:hypothetical protein